MKPIKKLSLLAIIFILIATSLSCSSIGRQVSNPSPSQSQTKGVENLATEPAQPATGNAPESSASERIPPAPTGTPGEPDAEATAQPAAPESTASQSTQCDNEVCIQDYPSRLLRPVGGEGRVTVDPSYRFGEFRKNSRSPNMGVEFLNSTGTPVIAAADGAVVVAGTDSQTAYARNLNQYGNLIILEHQLTDFKDPVYTLYAHLSEILVEVGDSVTTGQEIGKVGATGNIRGSVLHFEVRVGENTYSAVRNPELWLATGHDENGQALGALAGRISDSQGKIQNIRNIVLERLDSSGQAVVGRTYMRTYGGESLWGRSPWGESFGMGDMIPGTYKISYLLNGYQSRLIEVQAGKITLIEIIQ